MLGFIKKYNLGQKQKYLKRKYPGVNIVLHPDMPAPSINYIAGLAEIVAAVNSFEPALGSLSDTELKNKTGEFKERIAGKAKEYGQEIKDLEDMLAEVANPEEKERVREKLKIARNKIYADVLPEAFAVVREASRRTTGLRHFDVQIAGGVVLHEGKIAEMATGEGKTLVATLAAYLNALLGRGVHIVTVNDYLARRDREWMGPIYESLGLSVGVIQHEMSDEQRKLAYNCDIAYGTNNEFGFDYLRDNMKYSLKDLVQRPFYYAIVDEVDSILIDEARTPLIISGPAEESTDKYYVIDKIIPRLKGRIILQKDEIAAKYKGEDLSKGYDYIVDEKAHTAHLTDEGETKVCGILGIESLHDIHTMEWRHHVIKALLAHKLYKRDVDYVIKEGQVIIVDEFTGRMMPGRRWSDGLHQAVEAKEGLKIERENQTLATVTLQNYFRMYEKLAGMTGTAFTEANEFKSIYKLDVAVVPTNRPLIRTNHADCVYKTEKEKFAAVEEEITELYNKGRPVLVGTISIERSERLAEMLKLRGIQRQVLNAKYHELEAQIVAQAGRFKGVTIATNMAGRGTDILLGGNPDYMAKNLLRQQLQPQEPNWQDEYKKLLEKYKKEAQAEHDKVVTLGGLHVLGTERHEARRIDNQLRGRSGRQGDPGSSRFYVSLEDDLMRLFGSDKLIGIFDKLGLQEGQRIEHPWITKSIEVAQRRVEQHNFDIRKQLLDYDNVMNKQREVIYEWRRSILQGGSLKEDVEEITKKILEETLRVYLAENVGPREWDLTGLVNALKLKFGILISASTIESEDKQTISSVLQDIVLKVYTEKEKAVGENTLRNLERMAFLQMLDSKWKDHLYAMDNLREGISLRAYGQRDPLIEYRREAFAMFSAMVEAIEEDSVEALFKLGLAEPGEVRGVFSAVSQQYLHPEASRFAPPPPAAEPAISQPHGFGPPRPVSKPPVQQASSEKVGRNDPCPCGSGKKYKKCCGR
jgi:preprotein translocase subunit SecA